MTSVNKTTLWYCRVITAVAIMYCAIKHLTLPQNIGVPVVYSLFLVLSVFVTLEIPFVKSTKRPFPTAFCLLCLSLMLTATVILSYIFPASSDGTHLSPAYVLTSIALAPIFEELFFRWALINLKKPLLFAVFSSVVFALFHSIDAFVPTLLLGLLLSLFYISSKNIFLPIICHMGNNALSLICRFLGDVRIWVLLISALVFLLVLKFGDKCSDGKTK